MSSSTTVCTYQKFIAEVSTRFNYPKCTLWVHGTKQKVIAKVIRQSRIENARKRRWSCDHVTRRIAGRGKLHYFRWLQISRCDPNLILTTHNALPYLMFYFPYHLSFSQCRCSLRKILCRKPNATKTRAIIETLNVEQKNRRPIVTQSSSYQTQYNVCG